MKTAAARPNHRDGTAGTPECHHANVVICLTAVGPPLVVVSPLVELAMLAIPLWPPFVAGLGCINLRVLRYDDLATIHTIRYSKSESAPPFWIELPIHITCVLWCVKKQYASHVTSGSFNAYDLPYILSLPKVYRLQALVIPRVLI